MRSKAINHFFSSLTQFSHRPPEERYFRWVPNIKHFQKSRPVWSQKKFCLLQKYRVRVSRKAAESLEDSALFSKFSGKPMLGRIVMHLKRSEDPEVSFQQCSQLLYLGQYHDSLNSAFLKIKSHVKSLIFYHA